MRKALAINLDHRSVVDLVALSGCLDAQINA
jgi:hypothetical protein